MGQIINITIKWFSIFLLLIIAVFNIDFIILKQNNITMLLLFLGAVFFFAALYFILLRICNTKVNMKNLITNRRIQLTFIFLATFLLRFIFILCIKTPPYSDFKLMFDSAVKLAQGDLSYTDLLYFKYWGYQTPFVVYMGTIIKIFGPNIYVLKIINCILMSVTNCLIYLLLIKYLSQSASLAVSLVYAFYPGNIAYASILTNQIISQCFFMLFIYYFFSKTNKRFYHFAVAGFILSVANDFRPLALVYIIALLILYIAQSKDKINKNANNVLYAYEDCSNKDLCKQRIYKPYMHVANIIVFVISFLLITFFSSYLLKVSGVSKNGFKNAFPLWKFVVGLNYKTHGMYNIQDVREIYCIEDDKLREEAALNKIKERITNTGKLSEIIIVKNKIMWCENDRWIFITFRHILQNKKNYISVFSNRVDLKDLIMMYIYLEKSFYVILLFMAAFGLLKGFKLNSNMNYKNLLLYCTILFVIYWGIHNFIEIQTRYRYCIMYVLFIISSSFWHYIFSFSDTSNENFSTNK